MRFNDRIVQLQDWAVPLYRPFDWKVLFGGRYSGKTWAFSQAAAVLACSRPLRIAICRQFEKTIDRSALEAVKGWLERLDLMHMVVGGKPGLNKIRFVNGSEIFIQGLERNIASIKGLEDVDICWVEEAEVINQESWEKLIPTIRKTGAEIWVSFNPRYRSDPVWQMFVINRDAFGPGEAYIRKVNWHHMPAHWLTDRHRREMARFKQMFPHRYAHVYLGQPDDEGADLKVLPYNRLDLALLEYKPERVEGIPMAGFDVADAGADWNALVIRRGPAVVHVERWQDHTTGESTRRVDLRCREHGVGVLHYDLGGVGAGVRSELKEISPGYYHEGVHFGGAVKGGDTYYTENVQNVDFFATWSMQAAWAVRLRAEVTRQLEEAPYDTFYTFLIDPTLALVHTYTAELTQPEWDQSTGKMRLIKQPNDEPSPDLFDATLLAYASDCDNGLRAAA